MYAVVGRSTIGDFDQARKFLREEGIPRLSQMPGFVSGHWVRLGENTGASMVIFETEEAARTAKERFEANPPPTVTPMKLEIGEVQEHAP
jgi:hypothetical protein